MAPIKFEENIKDKLEKRILPPSAESWSKLTQRLDAEEKKSKNPIFWWLSIAAGLVIMIAVSIQFFNTDDSQEVLPIVVEENIEDKQFENKILELNGAKTIELTSEYNNTEEIKEDSPIVNKSQIIDYKKLTKKKAKIETQLAENKNSNIEDINGQQNDKINKESQDLINESFMKDAVANTLKELKSENTTVTDREIDSLLKVASKELFKEKLQNESTKTVDANALLLSVEDEMGQSFRSKVFEALEESYKTVKTAVAERNN